MASRDNYKCTECGDIQEYEDSTLPSEVKLPCVTCGKKKVFKRAWGAPGIGRGTSGQTPAR